MNSQKEKKLKKIAAGIFFLAVIFLMGYLSPNDELYLGEYEEYMAEKHGN
mgnify:FL=1